MPSTATLPNIPSLIRAYGGELRGVQDDKADTHEGSSYDKWAGVSSIVFARECKRGRDAFRANYFDYAQGKDLDEIVEERFRDLRIQSTPGAGEVILTRGSTAAGAGTVWQHTRIEAVVPGGTLRTFLVDADTAASASATQIRVPIESVDVGPGAIADLVGGGSTILRIIDPLWDNSWAVTALRCGPGTLAETDEEVRARLRQQRTDQRTGYPAEIVQSLKDAGATNVVLFGSDYTDTPPGGSPSIGALNGGYGDCGINRIFVGDAGYAATPQLVIACRKAITGSAVLGTGVGVWPIAPATFSVSVTAQLWKDPGDFDQDRVRQEVQNAVIDYFNNRGNAFYFRYVTIQGAVMRQVRDVQTLTFSGGPTEPGLTTFLNASPLLRYSATPADISVTIVGP